ncbi:hypothetical protein KKA27_00820 [Patescibacteria group bacterium]|nr:hypothetical protein [Patescibacteria group bacterium]MBU2633037.1 hypothetical protein [Patescibacteria group bacterium]
MKKRFCLLVVAILLAGFFSVSCLDSIKKGEGGMKKNDLNIVAPETAHRLSVKELQSLNEFFTKIEEFTGVERRNNPLILTGEEFGRIPKTEINLEIPGNVQFFISCFYSSAGHTLKSKTGVFVSQAILYSNKTDADLMEENLMKKERKHYSVVYRKGNIAGSTNMYHTGKPTKEFWELVNFIKENGFKITKVPPTSYGF